MKKTQVEGLLTYMTGTVNKQLLLQNECLLVNGKTKLNVRLP
jgi:hypothetical protein